MADDKEKQLLRRLKTDCCGMVVGEAYEAEVTASGAYARCKLPNGMWTAPHWTGRYGEGPWFEHVADLALVCPYCGRELSEDRNYCCKEAGHGEWVVRDE